MKGLHCQSDEYGISSPVLLSCQDHVHGVSVPDTPRRETLQAASKVATKNTDSFHNRKPALIFYCFCYCCSNWDLQSI